MEAKNLVIETEYSVDKNLLHFIYSIVILTGSLNIMWGLLDGVCIFAHFPRTSNIWGGG